MLSKRYSIGQLLLVLGIAILAFSASNGKPWAAPVSAEAEPTPVSAEVNVAPAVAVPGGPGYVMIPAVAFLPGSSSTIYTVFWGDLSVPNGTAGPQFFYAPVLLPQGARLTGMTLFFHDTTPSDGKTLGADMLRKPLPSSSSGESVGLSVYSNDLGNTLGQYQSDTTPDPTRNLVDNSQYAYWLSLYIYPAPSYLQLQAVRIDYNFSSAMPLIIK